MSMEDDSELQRLKQQKMLELQRRSMEEDARVRAESEKQAALRIVMAPEARQRLANLRMVKPDFAEQIEMQLLQLAQSGRIKVPISDEALKQILLKLTPKKRDITIRRL